MFCFVFQTNALVAALAPKGMSYKDAPRHLAALEAFYGVTNLGSTPLVNKQVTWGSDNVELVAAMEEAAAGEGHAPALVVLFFLFVSCFSR
jgi:hypothetical protein